MEKKLYLISDKWEYAIKLALEKPSEDTAICLLQDAVYLVSSGYYERNNIADAVNQGIKIYAIEKDVRARGLKDSLLPEVNVIGYQELVDLIFGYDSVINL